MSQDPREKELLEIIRKHEDPQKALIIATDIIVSVLTQTIEKTVAVKEVAVR